MSSGFSPITGMRECPDRTARFAACVIVLSASIQIISDAAPSPHARWVTEIEHRLDHLAFTGRHHPCSPSARSTTSRNSTSAAKDRCGSPARSKRYRPGSAVE